MLLLCEHCGRELNNDLDIGAWKARYLEMYDDQIDGHPQDDQIDGHPQNEVYTHKRRAVIVDTVDRLTAKQKTKVGRRSRRTRVRWNQNWI